MNEGLTKRLGRGVVWGQVVQVRRDQSRGGA